MRPIYTIKNFFWHLFHNPGRVVALFRLRYGRGNGMINFFLDIFQFGTLGTLFLNAVSGKDLNFFFFHFRVPEIPLSTAICLAFTLPVIFYLLGLFDEKKLKSWQEENRYQSRDLNPFFCDWREEMKKKQDRLEEKFSKLIEALKDYAKKAQD